jgi:hypothetical protein
MHKTEIADHIHGPEQKSLSPVAASMIDIASARLWLEEGFPVADGLTRCSEECRKTLH